MEGREHPLLAARVDKEKEGRIKEEEKYGEG